MFSYKRNKLYCENVSLETIVRSVGSPVYVYSRQVILDCYHAHQNGFKSKNIQVCYSVKANSNLSILKLLKTEGSGFDVVSGGELMRVKKIGADFKKVVFAGVGKTDAEIELALHMAIGMFNVESWSELTRIDAIAKRMKRRAPIAIRVNPNVDAKTHPGITTGKTCNKFGVPIGDAMALYVKAQKMKGIAIRGIDCHIGSQMTGLNPITRALKVLRKTVIELRLQGVPIDVVDVGGGLGVTYTDEDPPTIAAYAQAVESAFHDIPISLIVEPGRSLVANAGALVSRVITVKPTAEKSFAIIDAAMNDYIRSALYGAKNRILPVVKNAARKNKSYTIAGPVCESADTFHADYSLPELRESELVCMMDTGAYGASMASRYNSRPLIAEVLVTGSTFKVIRERETFEDMIRGEVNPV